MEEVKETILDFSQKTVGVLKFYSEKSWIPVFLGLLILS